MGATTNEYLSSADSRLVVSWITFGLAYSACDEALEKWVRLCKTDWAATSMAKIALLPQSASADQPIIVQADALEAAVFITAGRLGGSASVQIDASPNIRTSYCDGAVYTIMSPEEAGENAA
jgi:hypothetical protein